MNTPPLSYSLPITIFIADTDVTGLVYHANYLTYFERCRTSWLDALGLPLHQLMEERIIFVIKTAALDYIKPMRLGQTVLSTVTARYCKPCSMCFHQTLVDPDDSTLIYCKADILVACLDTAMKLRRLPRLLRELA